MEDRCEDIPLRLLHDPWCLLRPVDRDSIEYTELRDSIRDTNGVMNAIPVRPSARHPGEYEIIDGMWRKTASKELGFETMPCNVKQNVSDDDVLAWQVQANSIRGRTKPVEFARRLRSIMDKTPGTTMSDLSIRVRQSTAWIKARLGLLYLSPEIQLKVDRGEIPLGNAYMLARVPPVSRDDLVTQALTMKVKDFHKLAAKIIKDFTEVRATKKQIARFQAEFTPHAYVRPMKEIVAESERPTRGPMLMAAAECQTLMDVWMLAMKWVLTLDPESIEERRATHAKKRPTKGRG